MKSEIISSQLLLYLQIKCVYETSPFKDGPRSQNPQIKSHLADHFPRRPKAKDSPSDSREMNGHGGSNLKFAHDLMCFVCYYYDLDWGHTSSNPPSALRFTQEHAVTVGRYLQWLDDGMWSVIRLRLSLEDPEELDSFLTGVTMLHNLFQESVFSTHNYLFYCTLVAKFAVECANEGLHEAPSEAVFMMCQTLRAFRLSRTLSHSSDFHQESSTRTIL